MNLLKQQAFQERTYVSKDNVSVINCSLQLILHVRVSIPPQDVGNIIEACFNTRLRTGRVPKLLQNWAAFIVTPCVPTFFR